MTGTVQDQAEGILAFARRHPVLSLLAAAGGAVIAKKEYDHRYHGTPIYDRKEE
jgi:hypothetical protein